MIEAKNKATESTSWRALPAHTVFAVLDGRSSVDRAEKALSHAGVSSDRIEMWTGPSGAKALETHPDSDGFFAKIAHAMQSVGQDLPHLESYREEVEAGKSLMAVGYRGDGERERVETLLRQAGGKRMCRVGQWTLTDLG